MTLRRLRAITLGAVLISIVVIEICRQAILPYLQSWPGRLFMDAAISILALGFLGGLFHFIERIQASLERQHREVTALHRAALDIWDALTLETTLKRVVDQARLLVDARCGTLSVIGEDGRVESFVTSGDTAGEPPPGEPPAALCALPEELERRRVEVPILCKSPFRGNLRLAGKIGAKAQAVRELLRNGRSEEAGRHLEQLAQAAREVYADLRESIMGLRTGIGPERTMTEALAEFVAAWQGQTGVACRLSVDETLRLSPGIELQLLRIVQEALANVRKHAQAQQAEVALARADGRVVVTIADDGIGFNPGEIGRPGFPRFGLTTMRERAESVGGAVRWDSGPEAGTRVTVEIPLQPPTPLPSGSPG